MNTERMKKANAYHDRGFNCSQSVLAAFADVTGLSEKESFRIAAGFGRGAGTGELCGALSGAVMVLSLATPMDPADPVTGKKQAMAKARELRSAFRSASGISAVRNFWRRSMTPRPWPRRLPPWASPATAP